MSDLLDDNVFSLPDEEITSAGAEGNDPLEEAERTVLETPLSGEDDPFSVESSLADDFSAEEAFSEELPLEELPREDFRDELIPSDEFHAEDIPVDEPPAEDLPDDELPDDELPEAPVPPEKQSSDPAYGGDLPEDEEETGYQAQAEKAPRERYVMPRFLKTFIFAAAVFLGGFILSLFVWRAAVDVFAFSKPDREVTINIDEGSSMNDVIDDLHENGLVNYRWLFKAYCNLTHAEKKISTGTYTLNNLFDYHALVNGLRSDSGSRDIVRVMIKEGATCRQIFEQLAAENVCSVEDLENTAAYYQFDYSFLENLPYGNRYRLEGYLFPDTYDFYVDDDPDRVLKKFLNNFDNKFSDPLRGDIEALNGIIADRMKENGFTDDEIYSSMMDINTVTIVASIIEKESVSISESSSVATVIYNRLASKIYPLLQVDNTLRYYLNKYGEPLTDTDRAIDCSFNTDRHAGLPDGAICNPSIDSIRAALYPRNAQYLFYTMNESGSLHHFSDTYQENLDYIGERDKE